MNSIINSLLAKFKTWKEARVNRQPLLAENAYSIAYTGKNISFEEIYLSLKKDILERVKEDSLYNHTETYYRFPPLVKTSHIDLLETELEKLGYEIQYRSNILILVSWKKYMQ